MDGGAREEDGVDVAVPGRRRSLLRRRWRKVSCVTTPVGVMVDDCSVVAWERELREDERRGAESIQKCLCCLVCV